MTVFDKEAAMERVDGDVDLLRELVGICKDEFAKKLTVLRAAVDAQDGGSAALAAHSLKSALGNVGAMEAFKAAFELERAGRKQERGSYRSLLEALEQTTTQFFEHFDREQW